MESRELPKSDHIVVFPTRVEAVVDESLIPPGLEPKILDIPNGLNLPDVYDASWTPE
jgi:hypothetical protein